MSSELDNLDVQRLAGNWIYRCVENGVPLYDYNRITGPLKSWDEWCAAWDKSGEARLADAAVAEKAGQLRTAADLNLIAAMEFHFGKFLFLQDPEQYAATAAKAAKAYRAALTECAWPGRVVAVPHDGVDLVGVVRVPEFDGPHPLVIVVPGLDAAKEEMHLIQEDYLSRGAATVTVDGPGQGETEPLRNFQPDWESVAASIIDAAEGWREIDTQRIAIVGVSLGGLFAARAVSREGRLVAGASVGGVFDFGAAVEQRPPLPRQAFRVRSGAADDAEAEKLASEFAVKHAPAQHATPFLVLHGSKDTLVTDDDARAMAEHFGPYGELIIESEGNHVLHNLAYRTRPLVADWITTRLAAAL
jgi:alpha-beta hydrolase superfamily lysophospholipase